MSVLDRLQVKDAATNAEEAYRIMGAFLRESQYVGDVYSMGYEDALVIIHDYHRQQAGGIPSLSFLIASRLRATDRPDPFAEDSAIILLRVIGSSALPSHQEAERLREQMARKASGSTEHWDSRNHMDPYTANELSFAGVRCRIIGTFYLEPNNESFSISFGSDISNYYPNQGLKVYRPRDTALSKIVNFRDSHRILNHRLSHLDVSVGCVRYASTNRCFQGINNVRFTIAPADLLDQKTALFGMTRTGKSNTAKIIAKSVFELRFRDEHGGRIGQLIFDYNGEYANENVQDASGGANANALKNVWRVRTDGKQEDVVTYGSVGHPNDPTRKLTKLNFYADQNLQLGKEIINAAIAEETDKYLTNFSDASLESPENPDGSARTRYARAVFAYRSLLARAGFRPPSNMQAAKTSGLFGEDLRDALAKSNDDPDGEHAQAANILAQPQISWEQAAQAMQALQDYMKRGANTGYNAFNQKYMTKPNGSGQPWADQRLRNILGMFEYRNGSAMVARSVEQHSETVGTDYANEIYNDLCSGRLVIIDQSAGNPDINRAAGYRIMKRIFGGHLQSFTRGQAPSKILIYIEEAHNLLPSSKDTDTSDIWVRAAKEGAKLGIGLVYSTQEVSSIQKNILKATANWFIGHLNNTEETRELNKYYDFADFEGSILRAQDKGFLRVKTLSNPFVVPVQVDRFEVNHAV